MHLTKLRISLNANLAYGANFKVKLTGMVLSIVISLVSYFMKIFFDWFKKKK